MVEVKVVLYDFVRLGILLKELDCYVFNEIIKRGVKFVFKGLYGFLVIVCIFVNDEFIYGIFFNYVIKDGDIVKIDLGCDYYGYKSDSVFIKGVGKIIESDSKIIEVVKLVFEVGLVVIKFGVRVGDISYVIGEVIKNNNLYILKEYIGYGIGKELYEDFYILNEGKKGIGILLKDNMVICIEFMIL